MQEPSITPPPEARATECTECGDILKGEDAYQVQGLDFCGPDAARRAVDILDPHGSERVSREDLENARKLLIDWASEACLEKARGFAGKRSPTLHPVIQAIADSIIPRQS